MLERNRLEGDTVLIANPGEPLFTVTRTFNAPARFVWDAWTKPALMLRWYGNSCSTLEVCEMDVRPGGAWRRVLRMSDGSTVGFHGVYKELEPPSRVVFTEVFEPFPDHPSVVTVTMTERDGKTYVRVEQLHQSVQSRDAHIASGMEPGMRETLDRLERFVAALAASA
jgi:uncharacterized protein YndB with AHSA1/START domain